MTQLRPEAARGRAAGEADEAAAQLGSPPTGQSSQDGAGNRPGRNRAAACAVVAVIAAIASAVGAGLAPWWAAAAVAVVTAVYLAAIVFNLVMVFYGSARMALLSADETL